MIFNMAKITYFLRSDNNRNKTHSIYCRVTFKGSKAEFSMREKLKLNEWCQISQKMKGNSPKAKFIKTLLERNSYNLKTISIINEYHSAKELCAAHFSDTKSQPLLTDIITEYIESVRKKIKSGTLRNHLIKLQNLIDYEAHTKQKFYPGNFTIPEAEKFKQWFQERANTDNVTSACRNVSFYKISLVHSMKVGTIKEFPLLHYTGEKDKAKANIFLTFDELKRVQDFQPQNRQLKRIKDLFLFQCYTGLSFADLWQNWEFEHHGSKCLLIGTRQKNGQRFYVPLSAEALAILTMYDHQLPKYHNVVVNRILKEIACFCGIEKRITSHTGRKTFATVQDSLGWTRESIAKMLGHKSISTTEQYYIGETNQRILEEMKKVG